MTELRVCRRCAATLPARTPEGLCPVCLLETIAGVEPQEPGGTGLAAPTTDGEQNRRPRRLGDYELLTPIAHGGMGLVYRARQLSLDRVVALKLLPFGEFTRDDSVKRLRAEAESAAKLRHPNIVAIHEVGEFNGQSFFSMDYIEGQTLAEAAREGPMPIARAIRLLRTTAEAVHFAHEHGILHRDLKPANVLLDAIDQPHVTDFGLAKRFTPADLRTASVEDPATAAPHTLTGQPIGSPNYMPPEQAEGRTVGPTSDVYALGAILYHLLTGRPPFAGQTVSAVLQHLAQGEPVAPRRLNPAVPPDLETICLKCLEKDPAKRYATARELAEELARAQNDEPIRARPISRVERFWRWCCRRPAVALSLAAALVFLLAGLAATSWQWRRAENHAAALATTVTRLKLDQAEERLNGREAAESLALLAALLRENPANRVAAQRVVSILMQRNFLRPFPGEMETWHSRWTSGFAQSGDLLVTTPNGGRTLAIWDTSEGLSLKRTIKVGEPIRHCEFSGDGRLALVTTQAKSLRLYDVGDGSLRAGPYAIDGFSEQLLLAPDASCAIVVAGLEDALSAWRSHRGAIIRLSDGQRLHKTIQFHWAAFSPDGRWVATVSYGAAQIRDATTWEAKGKPLIHESRINSALFSPDSRRIVTASGDFNAAVWDVASGERLLRLPHAMNVQHASFSPDGLRIFSRDIANQGRLWESATGKMVGQAFPIEKGDGATSFSPDGRSLLSYSRKEIVPRDTGTTLPLAEPLATGDVPTRARFLSDGRRFVTTTMNGSTRLWDARPTAFAPSIFLEKLEMFQGSLSPDGTKLAIAVKSNWGRIWDLTTGEPIGPYFTHQTADIASLRWSPDSRLLLTVGTDRTARFLDGSTALPKGEQLRHTGPLTYGEFSPDGRWVVTASEDKTARIWNASNRQAVSPPLRHQGIVRRARFSPDGALVVTASMDGTVRTWSVPEGREIGMAITNELEFYDAIFSPNGRYLATAGKVPYARVWEVQSRQAMTPPLRHAGYITTIGFSPDGSHVVTGSSDGTARVWDAMTGQPVARPLRHREEVTVAEFSPDGNLVLTGSLDGTARLWDVATSHAMSDPFRHEERIVGGEWARDGKSFLTLSYDRRAKLWPVCPVPAGPAPPWLASLAEVSGILEVGGDQIFQPLPLARVAATFDHLNAMKGNDAWGNWLTAFLAPRKPPPVPRTPAQP